MGDYLSGLKRGKEMVILFKQQINFVGVFVEDFQHDFKRAVKYVLNRVCIA